MGEYWVVDPDERIVQVWDLAGGAKEPAIHGTADRLRWIPVGDDAGPTLEIEVADLFER